MRFSQMLSMLNGLLLSTNVAAITFTITDDFYIHSSESAQWSYSYPSVSTENIMDSMYLNEQ